MMNPPSPKELLSGSVRYSAPIFLRGHSRRSHFNFLRNEYDSIVKGSQSAPN